MKKLIGLMVIGLCVLNWSISSAETVDDLALVEESVCDKAGYTGELWGLCNAYCETMDCDGKDVNAADVACDNVLDNFISKSGGGELPCQVFGIRSEEQCINEFSEDFIICYDQYEIALNECNGDGLCMSDAEQMLQMDLCIDNAEVNAGLCLGNCTGNDCATECYELRQKADDKCYNKHCNNNGCEPPVLDACLENNYDLMNSCVAGCDKIDSIEIIAPDGSAVKALRTCLFLTQNPYDVILCFSAFESNCASHQACWGWCTGGSNAAYHGWCAQLPPLLGLYCSSQASRVDCETLCPE
jgi:hypothetical protein